MLYSTFGDFIPDQTFVDHKLVNGCVLHILYIHPVQFVIMAK